MGDVNEAEQILPTHSENVVQTDPYLPETSIHLIHIAHEGNPSSITTTLNADLEGRVKRWCLKAIQTKRQKKKIGILLTDKGLTPIRRGGG